MNPYRRKLCRAYADVGAIRMPKDRCRAVPRLMRAFGIAVAGCCVATRIEVYNVRHG